MNFNQLELYKFLDAKPRQTLDQMSAKQINAPLASSCGRLFDAVAAAMGLCRDQAHYEGQGAMELEALVCEDTLHNEYDELAYPFAIPNLPKSGLPYIEPIAMWNALLGDLHMKTPPPIMAARFHKGLAKIIAEMVRRLIGSQERAGQDIKTVALSGGCFQNKILLEQVTTRLTATNSTLNIISQARVPANDGGLSLGQAAIAAARHIYGLNGSGGA
jgi:hydrogenase maturation protein HypF